MGMVSVSVVQLCTSKPRSSQSAKVYGAGFGPQVSEYLYVLHYKGALQAQRVGYDGQTYAPPPSYNFWFTLSASTKSLTSDPAVAFDGKHFFVVWETGGKVQGTRVTP